MRFISEQRPLPAGETGVFFSEEDFTRAAPHGRGGKPEELFRALEIIRQAIS